MTKVLKERPPVWERAQKEFGFDPDKTVFTYGDTIYNPGGWPLNPDLVVHEEVHMVQQAKIGAELWWDKYFESRHFRMKQEVEAYKAQYKYFCRVIHNVRDRSKFLDMISSHLSSDQYQLFITKEKAKRLILK